ncbi:MAG TPA: polyketide antibiotic transporter [Glaciibacter sp.]|nr:polyketide antibiotic transporter [Glaciibacter sp.]
MSPTVRLTLFTLRRDRLELVQWVAGITALVLATSTAIATEFADEAERASIIALAVVNPAFLFLRGAPDGTGIGAVFFFQGFAFIGVLTGLMSTFSVIRNTRAEEDHDRAEAVLAAPIRREAPLVAALAVAVITNLLLAVAVTIALLVVGLGVIGAVLTGLAVAAVGISFVGVAAVAAQIAPSSRAANGMAAAAVGVAYLLRGIGDALGTPNPQLNSIDSAWLSWLSPIGWGQRVSPFSEQTAAPLLLSAAFAVVLATLALVIQRSRDLGSSLLHERPGPATASALRRTAGGIAWTLQRSPLIGWAIGAAVLAAFAGGLAPVVATALEDNPSLANLIARVLPGGQGDVIDVFATGILGICGILAAASGVHAVLRLRSEEASGAAELLLSSPLSRARWMGGHVGVAIASVILVALAAGVSAGIAFILAGADWERIPSSLAATLAHVPAGLTLVGAAAIVFAVVPRLAVSLGWGALVIALVLGQFGELLGLPEWVQNLSPFHHSSALPLESLDVTATVVMTVAAVVGIGFAVAAFRLRDLQP